MLILNGHLTKKTDLDVIVPRDLTIAKKCNNVEYIEKDEKIKFDYEVVISTTTGTDDVIYLADELKPSGKGSEFERSVAKVELCKADETKTVLSDVNWDADKKWKKMQCFLIFPNWEKVKNIS